jgi:hypothetical protein
MGSCDVLQNWYVLLKCPDVDIFFSASCVSGLYFCLQVYFTGTWIASGILFVLGVTTMIVSCLD